MRCLLLIMLLTPAALAITITEQFEDANLASRGWYGNLNLRIQPYTGGNTLEYRFTQGSSTPGSPTRIKFPASDKLYISYNIKYSHNWQWPYNTSNIITIMTNLEDDYHDYRSSHLTFYLEADQAKPQVAIQDSSNIDTSRIGSDLSRVTESRSVAGCNGDSDGYGKGLCQKTPDGYRNMKVWRAHKAYFFNDWVNVKVFLKLNTIQEGVGKSNGMIQYWLDGQLILNFTDVVFRTSENPGMLFNQFLLSPYYPDKAPLEQYLWLDNLKISTDAMPTVCRNDADRIPCDGCISDTELIDFIARWRLSGKIDMAKLIDAVILWKQGC